MGSESIRYLGDAARQEQDSRRSSGLKHLAAAHEKLARLQEIRRKLKQDYAERVAELHHALHELERSRSLISTQSELLDEYDARLQTQSRLIDDLQAEIIDLREQPEQRRVSAPRQIDAPSITVRAVDKYNKRKKPLIDEGSRRPGSLGTRLYRLLKSPRALDRP